ncbi:hypothetical protein M9H77_23085 [Catharanthus roseus]|uniref:Uncharacterized protein n=1 Tax=Catharanthus roseus TaxID=4058 RepID=A0ACC0ARX7_CATRO|nr:hypothetical protein M9H77_23085 [Catharanthus roseus]
MIHTHVPRYFFEKTLSLSIVENSGTEVLFDDAHLVHHFVDELSPIIVLPPLRVESSINLSTEDIDEGIEEGYEGEYNAKRKGSCGDPSLPSSSWVRALDPLMMLKIVAPGVVPHSLTPSTHGHNGPDRNFVDLEESVIASCNIEDQLSKFDRIRKGENPELNKTLRELN